LKSTRFKETEKNSLLDKKIMKSVFLVAGGAVLLVDLVSYYTRIDSSLLVQAVLAITGIALLMFGFTKKKERNWAGVQQPQQVTYHSVPKTTMLLPADPKAPDNDSERILRTVPDENAFYFYKMLHYYLDVRAKNLAEFFERLKSIEVDSIIFHVSRGDFREWFSTTLGDSDLARQVSTLGENDTQRSGEELRSQLASIVQTRLSALNRM
jgi:hypothetical protein